MFKKIKKYLSLYKNIHIEILETLCTICLYIERDGHFSKNPYAQYMGIHFRTLKDLSVELRSENK